MVSKAEVIDLLKGKSCNNCVYELGGQCGNWGQISKVNALSAYIDLPPELICEYWDALEERDD